MTAAQQSGLATVSALRAHEMSQAGEWFIVDVRTREEWRDGVPEGAALISMHEPGFLEKLSDLTGGDQDAKIALICAVGGRSGHLQPQLIMRGWRNVYNISEGMNGSSAGPGWIERELPVVTPE